MVRSPAKRPERKDGNGSRELIRRRIVCRGAVQGVGFRPTVHRLATQLALGGTVRNDREGVTIEVEGERRTVELFERRLPTELPPLARLAELESRDVRVRGQRTFDVLPSVAGARRRALVPPDAGLCDACRAELDDPDDRRHRYPFTTCSSCGPRFTLVRSLPYDRERTSMAAFPMCPECAREYADPADRRFHTETVACRECGPRAALQLPDGETVAHAARALDLARQRLAAGELLAVKGLGGYQLACRADDPGAVRRLREAKRRPAKPFAVMARDLGTARRLVQLSPACEALLTSARAPILLAPRRIGADLAPGIAPGLEDYGVMLPTTPLHAELFRGAPYATLVMTSGNRSDEPIARTEAEAIERLGPLVDALLTHEREVVRRADDSVLRATSRGAVPVRRSRGWVPEPLPLPDSAPEPVLALGGHLQTTACLALGAEAFPSQHVGDLDTEEARAFLVEVARGLEDFLQAEPSAIVADLHPDYASTQVAERLAAERGGRVLRVQHHLAHAGAVLAEHGRFPARGETVLAIALDGTGFGPSGNGGRATSWGCEWLALDGELRWRRLAHGTELPLVGGERAVREPWRVLCAALAGTGDLELLRRTPLAELVAPELLAQVSFLAPAETWPVMTGAGRVFEAAGALLGLAAVNTFEGEAAARLEALATRALGVEAGIEPWPEVELRGPELPSDALLAAAAHRVCAGEAASSVAAGFHATFARLAAELTLRVLPDGVRTVALGGGCFVNRMLATELALELERRGLEALLPREVPAGDGGLSYGQSTIAAVALARGCEPRFEGEAT